MRIVIDIPTFWAWLTRYAYCHAVKGKVTPVGLPGHRDPDARCDMYDPRADLQPGDCASDGHYLCQGCSHFNRERWESAA
jgi:hypothetical protein